VLLLKYKIIFVFSVQFHEIKLKSNYLNNLNMVSYITPAINGLTTPELYTELLRFANMYMTVTSFLAISRRYLEIPL